MSRSTRKTKIFGHCSKSTSEKQDKRRCNRIVRRTNKARVHQQDDEHLISPEEAMNVWSMNKDGKGYYKDATDEDMRK